MKILFAEWASYGRNDLKEAFIAEGHSLVCFPFSIDLSRLHNDPETEHTLSEVLHREVPDIVFSVAYFVIISKVCQREDIKYVSWTYDNPHVMLYSRTVSNPCNVICVFDKTMYLQFHKAGISTVRYLPLAANTERLDAITSDQSGPLPLLYDVSFLGSLYLEKNNYYDQMVEKLSGYVKGYLSALIASQLKIQGYDLVEENLRPIIKDLYQALPMAIQPDGMESLDYLYAQYIVNRRVTSIERIDLLETVAEKFTVDLFTHYKDFCTPNLHNHGYVDYNAEMPRVFRQSRINLNITLRGIQSGIPLRAFDIMGSGGFLLSNFQPDFLDLYVPGEDFVYYENKTDLLRKIDYYLRHEDERTAIARSGHQKTASRNTYRHRVREMLCF
ncbi:MAG: glycosyltransferase [Lachnospiraceae bacterium]|jgi:spore maturation protein CgeB|nr:glycosyltransferase [Lachnospiraceae bacterium]